MTSLWAAITCNGGSVTHINYIFLNTECVGTGLEEFSCWKLLGTERFTEKNHFFANFPTVKKCCGVVCAQFWCHRPPTELDLTVIPPSFQGKVAKCQHRNVETDQHKYFCSQTTVTTGHLAGQGGTGSGKHGQIQEEEGKQCTTCCFTNTHHCWLDKTLFPIGACACVR